MDKKVRRAVRCFVFKNQKVLTVKYGNDNIKAGYFEIPGGKIEEGETPEQTAKREVYEETGIKVNNLNYSGNMIVEYPDRIFNFELFNTNEFEGENKNLEGNTSQWMDIIELINKEKVLSNLIVLNKCFIKGLLSNEKIQMHIKIDEEENILEINYKIENGEI